MNTPVLKESKTKDGQTTLINFKGEMISIPELAERYNVNRTTLYSRYKQGHRDDDLITKQYSTTYIEHEGRRYTFEDLSEKYKIPQNTLRRRYREGYTGADLVRDRLPRTPNSSVVIIMVDDKPTSLTSKQNANRKTKHLTGDDIQERVNIGMSIDEALNFSKKYVVKYNLLCYEIIGRDSVYYLPVETIRILKDRGVSVLQLSKRAKFVDDICEIVEDSSVFEDLIIYEDEFDSPKVDYKSERMKVEERIKQYKEEKYWKEHQHLKTVPQKHNWGTYAEYLASSYSFACKEASKASE